MSEHSSSAWGAASGALTVEALRDTFRAIAEMPTHPCRLGQHVVSARALRDDGWFPCGNCGALVKIVDGRYA